MSRILTEYFPALVPFSKVISKHIHHKHTAEMSQKSDVVVLDILMKNEAKHGDMLDIMKTLHGYLGEDYPDQHPVLSGGDQMTCKRQAAAQRHMMDGNTEQEWLEHLTPVAEDWHCLVDSLGYVKAQVRRKKIHK